MAVSRYDVAVVGTGPAGLVAALRLAQIGLRTALVGPEPARQDGRSAALFGPAIDLLRTAGIWSDLAPDAGPLRVLRIVDDTGSLFRPPPVEFRAAEIGLEAFGWNVGNARLDSALAAAVRNEPGLVWHGELAVAFEAGEASATVRLAGGDAVEAALVVAADGRGSRIRQDAGIEVRERRYPQSAFTAVLAHERDHGHASTEFHTRAGPFTLVPLPGRRSSLVWVTSPPHARRLAAADDATLARAVERQAHYLLGPMVPDGPRGIVPLLSLSADSYTAPRLALIGEAAHVLPPIGAQGLNLGLADVAALVRLADHAGGRDPGDPALLRDYERERGRDVRLRSFLVDGLNNALLSAFLPVDAARGLGLGLLARIGPLRRAAMRAGLVGRAEPLSRRTGSRASSRS